MLVGAAQSKEKRTILATQSAKPQASNTLLSLIETSLDDDKAQAVTVIDLTGKTTIADAMIIASGTSSRQIAAMADHLLEHLKEAGIKGATCDGKEQGDWVLIDAGDVIVHLFRPEVRSFYNLEKMWDVTLPENKATAVGGRA